MAHTKYYRGSDAAAKKARQDGRADYARFSLDDLATKGRLDAAKALLTRKAIPLLYAGARRFKPVLHLGGLIHITRDEHVREVLLRTQDFPVPFGPEMAELGAGATFLLGLDGADHARLRTLLAQAILPRDVAMMHDLASRFTAALLDNHRGEIDVIEDCIKRVPAEICIRYFGLDCQDAGALADWTLAISALLFGDPFGDPQVRRTALHGRDKLAAFINDAIARTREHVLRPDDRVEHADTLVHRFLILQRSNPDLTDSDIAAMLIGMASGFIPTNTIAASNMLTEVLARPVAFAAAVTAADADDAATMRRIMLEAGRLNPTLAPGQFRLCPKGAELEVDGKTVNIPPRSTLLVSTVSAMRDPRVWADPGAFRLDRAGPDGGWQEPDLLFGLGPHVCIGKEMALAQIGGVFTQVFKRAGLRRAPGKAGKLSFLGLFPRHLRLAYDTPAAQQSMYLLIMPVTDGASQHQLEQEIADNSWLVIPADNQIIFDLSHAEKWHGATKRLGIQSWQLSPDAGHA